MEKARISMAPPAGMKAAVRIGGNGSDAVESSRPKPPDPYSQRYVVHTPWDLRLHAWVASLVIVPADYAKNDKWPRLRRLKFWLFGYQTHHHGKYPSFRRLLTALFGGFVGADEHAERMAACDVCNVVRVKLPRAPGGTMKQYCGACNCPNWLLSRLDVKNKFRKWYCPRGKHGGTHPLAWLRDMVADDKKRLEESKNHGD